MRSDKMLVVGIVIVLGMMVGLVAALLFIGGGASGSSDGCVFVKSGKTLVPICR